MEFKKICAGRALYTECDKIWVAKGMTFFAVDYNGRLVAPKNSVGNLLQRLIGSFRLSRQLLREGIHHLLPLADGSVFVVTKKKAYVVDAHGKILHRFSGFLGNKPAHQGVCVTPDGNIFFAEYTLNMERDKDTHLYRSLDGGATFECVLTMPSSEIRHMHFVKYDPYEKCLWLGTGDEDRENKLMRSFDNGDTWETVGEGSQDWRAIGICFDAKYVTWGTDAGSVPDQNHIIRMDRNTHELEVLADAEGPCHGCASLTDGRVFISTGIEGGENEKDRCARLKSVGAEIKNEFKLKKDIFPLILQYGVMRFPLGTDNTDRLVFTTMGLKKNGECVYVEKKQGLV